MRYFAVLFASTMSCAQSGTEAPSSSSYLMVTGWCKDAARQWQYTQAVGPILRAHRGMFAPSTA